MDKFSFFILNIALNSCLAFFTTLLLVEILLVLLRIRQGRLAAGLRMIPLFKLILDPFMYDFSRWAYLHGINPLQCEEGTRTFSALIGRTLMIQMTLTDGLTFTVADVVGYLLPPVWLSSIAIFILLASSLNVIRCFFLHTNIVISSSGSPYVIGKTIYIPRSLYKILTHKEYRAVIAHEREHIRCKDGLVRLLLELICSFFWWIPTKWLRNRIEEGQEIGCDLQCKKYGVDPVDLAGAICKSAKHLSQERPFAHYLVKKHAVQTRIDTLLKAQSFKKTRFIHSALAVSVAIMGILLGRYWIF